MTTRRDRPPAGGCRWPASLLAISVLLIAGGAAADVVTGPPPEDDCPEGSTGFNCAGFGHGSDTCRPQTCSSDEDCGEEGLCETASLCIARVECNEWSEEPVLVSDVLGSCDDGEACESGACETLQVCSARPVFNGVGGCDCSQVVTGRDSGALVLMSLAAALALSLLRRRRGE